MGPYFERFKQKVLEMLSSHLTALEKFVAKFVAKACCHGSCVFALLVGAKTAASMLPVIFKVVAIAASGAGQHDFYPFNVHLASVS